MATIEVQKINGPYVGSADTTPLTPIVWTAASTGADTVVIPRHRVLVLFHNAGASERTVSIASSFDAHGRKADISAFALPAGGLIAKFLEPHGWEQATGGRNVEITGSHADVKIAAIQAD